MGWRDWRDGQRPDDIHNFREETAREGNFSFMDMHGLYYYVKTETVGGIVKKGSMTTEVVEARMIGKRPSEEDSEVGTSSGRGWG